MKRELSGFFVSIVLFIVILGFISFVFAQFDGLPPPGGQTNFEVFFSNLSQVLSRIFNGITLTSLNATTYLFGILLWMVLYSIVRTFDLFGDRGPLWTGLFSLLIVLIIFFGLPSEYEQFLQASIAQMGAVGATILALIPFLIMLYFTMAVAPNLLIAQFIWIVYVIYYFIIMIHQAGLRPLWAIFTVWFGGASIEDLAYLAAIIVGIIMAIFIGFWREKFFENVLKSKEEKGKKKIEKANVGADILGGAVDTFGK